MVSKQLKGGALFQALAISVVIGLLISGVILAQSCHVLLLRNDHLQCELRRNVSSAAYLACIDSTIDEEDIDLYERGKDSVKIVRSQWGVYDVLLVTAHTGASSYTRCALLGTAASALNYAVWLADMDRPLRVTGNTLIKGTAYLPHSGVERAYIEGRSFSGRDLVQGNVLVSSRFIPDYNHESAARVQSMQHETFPDDSIISWQETVGDTMERSFLQTAIIISEATPTVLTDVNLSGHILVRSSTSITVNRTARLDQVVLVAPRIYIDDNVTGNFQAFARDSIVVGEKVELQYPSVLCVVADKNATSHPAIVVAEEANICGEVFLVHYGNEKQHDSRIVVNAKAVVHGNVYSSGAVDMKGTVQGSLCCSRLVLQTNSAVYDNHLMDATIDLTARNPYWLGCNLNKSGTHDDVLQWLE